MFDDHRHKRNRILVITNPDSDSDGGSDDVRRAQDGRHVPYIRRPLPSNTAPHNSFKGPQSLPHPPSLTTNFPNDSPVSHPPLSSPSTASSPAQESTPPPTTPALQVPPVNLTGVGSNTLPEMAISTSVDRGMPDVPQPSNPRTGKHLPSAKPAFGSRPRQPVRNVCCMFSYQFRRLLLILKCHAKSPTVSYPPATSPSTNISLIPIGDQVFVVVTSDSARSITVDISNAHDPASIRERIFTQVGGLHFPDCNRLTTLCSCASIQRKSGLSFQSSRLRSGGSRARTIILVKP